MSSTGGKKTSWPEVVGMPVEEAEKVIKKDMPEANIVVLASGSLVTLDLRSDRVRIFVDTVTEAPRVWPTIPLAAVYIYTHSCLWAAPRN